MSLVAPILLFAIAQGPSVPLTGTVVGPGGGPVAGAELFLAGMPVYDPPILARGTSDASGKFRLDRPAALAGETKIIAPTLWVVKPGLRLSMTRFPGAMPGADEPLRVVLGPPGGAEVRVDGPDGKPAAGVRVRVEWFGKDATNVPDPVVDRIEATTDGDGLAVVDAAANDEVRYVDVRSEAFGIQGRRFAAASPKRVSLRAAVPFRGRLVSDPKLARGWRVRAYTYWGDRTSPDPETTGYADATTDLEGRFSFPAIAPGALDLRLEPPGKLPVLADLPRALSVSMGGENVVEIPLVTAATVTGLVRERGTGKPVAGVEFSFGQLGGGTHYYRKTDVDGRYTFPGLPGESRISLHRPPPSHAEIVGIPHWKDFRVPPGPARVELEPVELIPAAPPIRGVVRDESGRPVVGASVGISSRGGGIGSRGLVTDERGEFALTGFGLARGTPAEIKASRGERKTAKPVEAVAGVARPVDVVIVPGLTVALAGRVVGPGGLPVAGAALKFQSRTKEKPGQNSFAEQVGFDDGLEVRTAPDGTFLTPRSLDRRAQDFRVDVTAEGFLPNTSGWVASSGGDVVAIPDIPLRRSRTLRPVAGRVVDREGLAVAGAAVFQSGDGPKRTSTTTDAAGGFRLAGVASGEALIFVEKAGYRFGGAAVGPGAEGMEVRIGRVEEPPIASMKSLPPSLTRAEERAMARELFAPLIPAATSGDLGMAGHSAISTLARLDPDRVLAMLENRALIGSTQALLQVALGQFEDDPRAAIATIEADRDPAVLAAGFLALAEVADPKLEAEFLDRALAEARRVADSEAKIGLLGRVADHWLDRSDLARATPILREGQALIATLPKGQYYPGVEGFADVLAAIDLPAARPIFAREGVTNASKPDPATIERHHGEAAVRLATIDPAGAERLVPAVVPNFWDQSRSELILRIARRMARVDLPRARTILESIRKQDGPGSSSDPVLIPYGLGLMAAELAGSDPARARGLLDEAFDGLRKIGTTGYFDSTPPASCLMAGLLPVVERIDPDRLAERTWLAASCRPPSVEVMDAYAVQARMDLAALISRYDRAMAAAIVTPAIERLPELLADSAVTYLNSTPWLKALAAYDPHAVVVLLLALPDSARKAPEKKDGWNNASLDAQVRLAAAEMLGLPVEERRVRAGYYPSPLRRGR